MNTEHFGEAAGRVGGGHGRLLGRLSGAARRGYLRAQAIAVPGFQACCCGYAAARKTSRCGLDDAFAVSLKAAFARTAISRRASSRFGFASPCGGQGREALYRLVPQDKTGPSRSDQNKTCLCAPQTTAAERTAAHRSKKTPGRAAASDERLGRAEAKHR